MRTIDTNIVSQLESGQIAPFTLLHFIIDATDYTYTDCDVPIGVDLTSGGGSDTLYNPRGMELTNLSYSDSQIVDRAEFSLDNTDDVLTSIFVDGTPQGSDVYVYLAILNTSHQLVENPVVVFQGELDDWSLAEGKIEFSVASVFKKWARKTQSRQTPSCRWRVFGGTECGYSGAATWCDRTYTRCEALGNTANFGGERYLSSIIDRTIWWGRTPENG